MRQAIQFLVIAGLLFAAGVVIYRFSGAGDPPADGLNKPRYPATWLEDWPAAQAQAAREHKPILIDFQGSDWCVYCIKFHTEIADTAEFQAFAREQLVLMSVDFPRHKLQTKAQIEANEALATHYGVEGLPTLLLLRPDGSVLARMGYAPGGAQPWLSGLAPLVERYRREAVPAATGSPAGPSAATAP